MSDHRPEHDPACEGDAAMPSAESDRDAEGASPDHFELDFSRLRKARASLDTAFRER